MSVLVAGASLLAPAKSDHIAVQPITISKESHMSFSEIEYCTDKLIAFWKTLQPAFKAKYPGWGIYVNCSFRPPEEQFQLFCKGRRVVSHIDDKGKRVIDEATVINPNDIVTKVDGVTRVGSHSTGPSTAFDVAISNPDGHNNYHYELPQWNLKEFLVPGIIWGGNWGKRDEQGKLLPGQFVDPPHFEDTDYTEKMNSGRLV